MPSERAGPLRSSGTHHPARLALGVAGLRPPIGQRAMFFRWGGDVQGGQPWLMIMGC